MLIRATWSAALPSLSRSGVLALLLWACVIPALLAWRPARRPPARAAAHLQSLPLPTSSASAAVLDLQSRAPTGTFTVSSTGRLTAATSSLTALTCVMDGAGRITCTLSVD